MGILNIFDNPKKDILPVDKSNLIIRCIDEEDSNLAVALGLTRERVEKLCNIYDKIAKEEPKISMTLEKMSPHFLHANEVFYMGVLITHQAHEEDKQKDYEALMKRLNRGQQGSQGYEEGGL